MDVKPYVGIKESNIADGKNMSMTLASFSKSQVRFFHVFVTDPMVTLFLFNSVYASCVFNIIKSF